MTVRQLDDRVLVSGQIMPADVADLRRHGVTMIVNNRPDGEDPGQPLAADIEQAARSAGIDYCFLPIRRGPGPAWRPRTSGSGRSSRTSIATASPARTSPPPPHSSTTAHSPT